VRVCVQYEQRAELLQRGLARRCRARDLWRGLDRTMT